MKKRVSDDSVVVSATPKKSFFKRPVVIISFVLFFIFFVLPILFNSTPTGNVALIKVEGIIMGGSSGSSFTSNIVSSQSIVNFIKQADENPSIKAIVLEINSPGGSAVASDEIATAIKQSTKPTISLIREVGASGGYWIASATDHSVANRMSITGSIGVISSYLEFGKLMEEYGVKYQRMVAGERKDLGTPFKTLTNEEEQILQNKLDMIHDYFIQAVAENRNLSEEEVKKIATGEFYLGVEAYQMNLIDELGDINTVTEYLQQQHSIEEVEFQIYESKPTLTDLLQSLSSEFSFNIGKGIGDFFFSENNQNIIRT